MKFSNNAEIRYKNAKNKALSHKKLYKKFTDFNIVAWHSLKMSELMSKYFTLGVGICVWPKKRSSCWCGGLPKSSCLSKTRRLLRLTKSWSWGRGSEPTETGRSRPKGRFLAEHHSKLVKLTPLTFFNAVRPFLAQRICLLLVTDRILRLRNSLENEGRTLKNSDLIVEIRKKNILWNCLSEKLRDSPKILSNFWQFFNFRKLMPEILLINFHFSPTQPFFLQNVFKIARISQRGPSFTEMSQ